MPARHCNLQVDTTLCTVLTLLVLKMCCYIEFWTGLVPERCITSLPCSKPSVSQEWMATNTLFFTFWGICSSSWSAECTVIGASTNLSSDVNCLHDKPEAHCLCEQAAWWWQASRWWQIVWVCWIRKIGRVTCPVSGSRTFKSTSASLCRLQLAR